MSKKDEIIHEIRRIADKLRVTSLRRKDFNKHSKIPFGQIRYYFGSWNNAIKEANLKPLDNKAQLSSLHEKKRISEKELLLELICLHNEYQKQPTYDLINSKGKYSTRPYVVRWGSIPNAFLIAQKEYPNLVPTTKDGSGQNETSSIRVIPQTIRPTVEKKKKHTVFGEPINFRGLRFAPINEQGVVYLFGMISHELGYLIESIRTDYPDCEGKRCFDKDNNQWEHVRIEFEYKSSNFLEHAHDEEGSDLIVCWIHDWADCPLEVLELRSAIKYL